MRAEAGSGSGEVTQTGRPADGARILVVDDDPATLRFLARSLHLGGFECDTAASVTEATASLASIRYALILTDVDMPGGSGLDLLEMVSKQHPDVATVMVTGLDDRTIAEKALEDGAYGYVIKPFEANELLIMVSNALRRRSLELESRRLQQRLERMLEERTTSLWDALREVERVHADLKESQEKTVRKLSIAAEFRDTETADHVHRVSRYTELLAEKVNLDAEFRALIGMASAMHDVGKIGVPDSILLKPGALTSDEFEQMKLHAEIGERILADDTPLLDLAATIAYTHHEHHDGNGYPRGLTEEEIPLVGRIAAIADVFDALTTNRVYRPAYPLGQAIDVMVQERGSHFDPDLLDAFLSSMDEVLAVRAEAQRVKVAP